MSKREDLFELIKFKGVLLNFISIIFVALIIYTTNLYHRMYIKEFHDIINIFQKMVYFFLSSLGIREPIKEQHAKEISSFLSALGIFSTINYLTVNLSLIAFNTKEESESSRSSFIEKLLLPLIIPILFLIAFRLLGYKIFSDCLFLTPSIKKISIDIVTVYVIIGLVFPLVFLLGILFWFKVFLKKLWESFSQNKIFVMGIGMILILLIGGIGFYIIKYQETGEIILIISFIGFLLLFLPIVLIKIIEFIEKTGKYIVKIIWASILMAFFSSIMFLEDFSLCKYYYINFSILIPAAIGWNFYFDDAFDQLIKNAIREISKRRE